MMTMPEGFEPWTCDFCTAACTFEAMNWCQTRWNRSAECGYENDKPWAFDSDGRLSPDGCFEFAAPISARRALPVVK